MSVVLFDKLKTVNGQYIGRATLNVVKAHNALNLEMIRCLYQQLTQWQHDNEIAMVILEGAGEKAFCAGGDVVSLYHAMQDDDPENLIETFFTSEYRLDYLIHCYEKPIMLWGNGIIMGGGLGLTAGASHRVMTETSRIAMPEITIGLYPDVGGSYFLNKMPDQVGLFLGLTGASINAMDAKYVGLCDHYIESGQKAKLMEVLMQTAWGKTQALNHEKLTQILNAHQGLSSKPAPANIKKHSALFKVMAQHRDLADKVNAILDYQSEDTWLQKAQKSVIHGSPLSAHIIARQLEKSAQYSLKACFQLELGLSVHCGRFGEFKEGVRALLIDKDGAPKWRYQTLATVDQDVVSEFFKPLWDEACHPLNDL